MYKYVKVWLNSKKKHIITFKIILKMKITILKLKYLVNLSETILI